MSDQTDHRTDPQFSSESIVGNMSDQTDHADPQFSSGSTVGISGKIDPWYHHLVSAQSVTTTCGGQITQIIQILIRLLRVWCFTCRIYLIRLFHTMPQHGRSTVSIGSKWSRWSLRSVRSIWSTVDLGVSHEWNSTAVSHKKTFAVRYTKYILRIIPGTIPSETSSSTLWYTSTKKCPKKKKGAYHTKYQVSYNRYHIPRLPWYMPNDSWYS